MNNLRHLPSVDQLLQTESARSLIGQYGRSLTVEALRSSLEKARMELRQAGKSSSVDSEALLDQAGEELTTWFDATLVPVINASGVILHTNLGRAPLSGAALQAVRDASETYSNLEYDLVKGQRGSRSVHAEGYLQLLLGVEAGLVVNNNAGAVLLALSALAKRRRVIIARSQLVEIGGGFRIPDVMAQSGARLVEVGTTNRVHLSDYEEAMREAPGILFHAHHSNFKIVGFTAEPSLQELAELAARYQSILIDDQGSGALLDTSAYGLAHEPTVQESLAAGSDLVCFSSDKLLGGPQAGIVVGRRDLMEKLKRHPLARALRADKMALAALSATLRHYLKGEAAVAIP
ncbi:MAG: L-seryl-tRNA(Sec) selenium transferase, partial [Anaerolineae bacterium]|nr:L-seryl-tRNA(Sec) selenium transferase [Anaerolineae bacterium]